MKKVLLDLCYQEEIYKLRGGQGGEVASLFTLPYNSPIVKKIETMIIG